MSIGVMLILGVAAIFVGWKVWKMIQGKNDGGCCGGSGSSCSSGCGSCPSRQEKK